MALNQAMLERLFGRGPLSGITRRVHEFEPYIPPSKQRAVGEATLKPVLEFVIKHPWSHSWQIAKALGRPTGSVTCVLTKLIRDGRLKRRGANRKFEYSAA